MDQVIVEEDTTPGCLDNQVGCSSAFRRPGYKRYLVDRRKVEMPNKEMRFLTEVIQSIRENDFQSVKNILETRFKKKERNGNYLLVTDGNERFAREVEACIMEASRLQDSTILKYLLDHGAQVNFLAEAPTPGVPIKTSPLHIAVGSGLPDTVSLLLENNADVNRLDHNGRSSLHLAVKRADCECTRMLLFRGANVHNLDHDGQTPLQIASKYGHVELVRILLEHSAQIFHEGQTGPSPLHIAAIEGHVPLIDIFSRYVDVNIRVPCTADNKDKTALHLAAERGLVETVRFLLERFGANVNLLDSDDQNALHCALLHKHDHRRMRRKEDFDVMVDLFLKKQVKINQANANGDRPLHLASKNQFHRVVELLLLARADPLLKNHNDQIPLDVIADYDLPMRQLFTKYAVITSPYISENLSDSLEELELEVSPTVDHLPTKPNSPLRRSYKEKPAPTPKLNRTTPKDKRKVFHLHVKGMPTESSTEGGIEGPHRSIVYTTALGKTPSAPSMVH